MQSGIPTDRKPLPATKSPPRAASRASIAAARSICPTRCCAPARRQRAMRDSAVTRRSRARETGPRRTVRISSSSVQIHRAGIVRAAEERAQQHRCRPARGPAHFDDTHVHAVMRRRVVPARDDEAAAAERMRDGVARPRERDARASTHRAPRHRARPLPRRSRASSVAGDIRRAGAGSPRRPRRGRPRAAPPTLAVGSALLTIPCDLCVVADRSVGKRRSSARHELTHAAARATETDPPAGGWLRRVGRNARSTLPRVPRHRRTAGTATASTASRCPRRGCRQAAAPRSGRRSRARSAGGKTIQPIRRRHDARGTAARAPAARAPAGDSRSYARSPPASSGCRAPTGTAVDRAVRA